MTSRLSDYIEKIGARLDEKYPEPSIFSHDEDCECSDCTGCFSREDAKAFAISEVREALRIAAEEVEGLKADHIKRKENMTHSKDEIYCCIDCHEDDIHNQALTDAANLLRSVDKPV